MRLSAVPTRLPSQSSMVASKRPEDHSFITPEHACFNRQRTDQRTPINLHKSISSFNRQRTDQRTPINLHKYISSFNRQRTDQRTPINLHKSISTGNQVPCWHSVLYKCAPAVVPILKPCYWLSEMQVILDANEVWNSLSRYGR
jgi:hypothetical protein